MLDISHTDALKKYDPMIRRTAHTVCAKLPANVEVDDLIQVGRMGLLHACAHYDSGSNVTFETYAMHRVKGAMLDNLRQTDFAPRNLRRDLRNIQNAENELFSLLGRRPTAEEIADRAGLPLKKYFDTLGSKPSYELPIYAGAEDDETDHAIDPNSLPDTGRTDPVQILLEQEKIERAEQALERLSDREKKIIQLHIQDDLNLAEIGKLLAVTEGRVCQIYHAAIEKCHKNVEETAANRGFKSLFTLPKVFSISAVRPLDLKADFKKVFAPTAQTAPETLPPANDDKPESPFKVRFLLPEIFTIHSGKELHLSGKLNKLIAASQGLGKAGHLDMTIPSAPH